LGAAPTAALTGAAAAAAPVSLAGVAVCASGPSSAIVVGFDVATSSAAAGSLALDTGTLSPITVEPPGGRYPEFTGVSRGGGATFAVGYAGNGQGSYGTGFVEQLVNGQFRLVKRFHAAYFSVLFGVHVVSATDVWAVGEWSNGSLGKALIEHYDGKSWHRMRLPEALAKQFGSLRAAGGASADDLWFVGTYGGDLRSLVLHWDGKSLSWVRKLGGGAGGNARELTSLVPPRPGHPVLTVGASYFDARAEPLGDKADGHSWRALSVSKARGHILWGVGKSSSAGAWAVGSVSDGPDKGLAYHIVGDQATAVELPLPPGDSFLYGITRLRSGSLLAVGYYGPQANLLALTCHDGTWKLVQIA
jgi:hypothetical protein